MSLRDRLLALLRAPDYSPANEYDLAHRLGLNKKQRAMLAHEVRLVLKAGASGYMNKESAPQDLIGAIRKILGGGRYVSANLAERLAFDSLDDSDRPLHETLSSREFEILRMITEGKPAGRIAEELHLSVTTVSTHRAHILEKMRMTTTSELMHYGLSNHLAS